MDSAARSAGAPSSADRRLIVFGVVAAGVFALCAEDGFAAEDARVAGDARRAAARIGAAHTAAMARVGA